MPEAAYQTPPPSLFQQLLHDKARLLRSRIKLLAITFVAVAIAVALRAVAVTGVVVVGAVGLVAAQRFDVTRYQFAVEHMALEFNEIAGVDSFGTAQAFCIDVDVGAGAVFKKTITFGNIEPLDCCFHNVI